MIRRFAGKLPILGVCLGHQSIDRPSAEKSSTAEQLMHGKTSDIRHNDSGVFHGLPDPLTATRYHSLVIEKEKPARLSRSDRVEPTTARSWGVRHRDLPVEGVQFHPESILTEKGHELLANFLRT